jgi:hypothetical protein
MDLSIFDIVFNNGLEIIPLQSITNNKCTCKKENCRSPGKHPLLNQNWKFVATNNMEKINEWINKNENINFAVVTGNMSKIHQKYLVVIDIDKENPEFIAKLPKTFVYKTGNNGYHYWFWSKVPIKNSVSSLAENIDIRGQNGYVVIPPSKHISGKCYEMLKSATTYEINDLPNEIVEHLSHSSINSKKIEQRTKSFNIKVKLLWDNYTVSDIKKLLNQKQLIPEGSRNNTIFRLLCSERSLGLFHKNDLLQKATEYKKLCENHEKITSDEIEKIVLSVMKYPIYNRSHENVNNIFINSFNKDNNFYKEKLYELDSKFFQSLNHGENGITLNLISDARKNFFEKNGLSEYSNYKPSLLGAKLRDMGFVRIRTAKANLWKIKIGEYHAREQ